MASKNAVDREATGRENLLLQGRLYGLRGAALRTRVDDLLTRFSLAHAADRVVKGWSGGMQRRLDVALGLVARPQVLFLDEPTTGLDPEVRVAMWDEISTRQRADRGRGLAGAAEGRAEGRSHLRRAGRGRRRARAARGGGARARRRRARDRARRPSAARPRRQGARAVPAVLAALESEGVPVAAVSVARASLDDVYLRYTGRTFESADEASASSQPETATVGGR